MPHWALSFILDQNPPDSQMLKLDETMDSLGDDDPFTAKLSFEVRHLKSGRVLRCLGESHQSFSPGTQGPQLVWQSATTSDMAVGKRTGQLPVVTG